MKVRVLIWYYAIVVILSIILGGCASSRAPVVFEAKTVQVPVQVACIRRDQFPAKPTAWTADPQLAARTLYEKVTMVLAELTDRIRYEQQLEALMEMCAQ